MSPRQKLILGITCLFLILMTLTTAVLRGTPTYAQNEDNSMQLALHQTFFGLQVIAGLPALALLTNQASTPQQAIAEASSTATALTSSVTHAATNIAHAATFASTEKPATTNTASTTQTTTTPIFPTPTPKPEASSTKSAPPPPSGSSTPPTQHHHDRHGG